MTRRYLDLLFTPSVRAAQTANGSREVYAARAGGDAAGDRLTEAETAFIASRDSFYMATVSAGGWPYLQHRGGPPGFVRVIDDRTLALADVRGNRQYISLGNLADDSRAALFFMDYPRRARLKLLARVRAVTREAEPALAETLAAGMAGAGIRAERTLMIDVEAFDWNCPQHITPRFTVAEIQPSIDALKSRIVDLEAEVARLRAEASA